MSFFALSLHCLLTLPPLASYWLVWWQENQFNKDRGFYEVR